MEKCVFCCLVLACAVILMCEATNLQFDRPLTTSCKDPVTFRGCSIEQSECVCSKKQACENPFPYRSHRECEKDKKGLNDKCRRHPCVNGQCVQIKREDGRRRWQCQCAGSGYYGHRCQRPCPHLKNPLPPKYPSACIY